MFRPIRKRKNEIDRSAVETLLNESRRGVLAVNGEDGYPYAIPVNYLYDKETQKIYFHGARAGYKVCFTVCGNETVREEAWAPFVQSAVIFGRCHLLDGGPSTMAVLKRFMMKYYPSEQLAEEEIARSGKAVQLFEITVEHLSGKEVQER